MELPPHPVDQAYDDYPTVGREIRGSDPSPNLFTTPERIDGEPFSVLELTDRHEGYRGFSPPNADSLMQSTVQGGQLERLPLSKNQNPPPFPLLNRQTRYVDSTH